MIKSIYFKSLRSAECIQFFTNILAVLNTSDLELLKSIRHINDLTEKVKELNESIIEDRRSKYTGEIEELDERRDKAISCLRGIVFGYRNHFNKDKQKASVFLLKRIDAYGKDIALMNYQAQSSTLRSLTTEFLSDEKIIRYTQLLHVDEIVIELENANNAFEEVFIARLTDNAGKKQISTTELIKSSIPVYKELIASIEAYARVFPSDNIEQIINRFNGIINGYMLEVRKRKGRKNKDLSGSI